MDKFSVTLTKSKETKGTHVYANEAEGMSIYIPKAKITGAVPAAITLTFEPVGGAPAARVDEPEM